MYLFRWCEIKSQYLCIFTVRHFQNVVCAIEYICSTKYIKETNPSLFYITVWLFLLKAHYWHFSPINQSADINVTPSRDASDEDGSKYFRYVSNNLRVLQSRKKKHQKFHLEFVLFLIMSISTCLLGCYILNRPLLGSINIRHFQQMNAMTCWLSGCNMVYFLRFQYRTSLERHCQIGQKPDLWSDLWSSQLRPVQHWYSSNSIKNDISVSWRASNPLFEIQRLFNSAIWCQFSVYTVLVLYGG